MDLRQYINEASKRGEVADVRLRIERYSKRQRFFLFLLWRIPPVCWIARLFGRSPYGRIEIVYTSALCGPEELPLRRRRAKKND